jgi:hypothetical protein
MEEGVEGEVQVVQEEAGGGDEGLDGEERRERRTDRQRKEGAVDRGRRRRGPRE